ncbi:hypothetical protein [Lysobacter capsici]|uniref:hypothetical protein n=1 Tax=Lysobacter capsici TaxID=435897 RepID=UPI001C000E7F|nr:hypothetical protein [Lysobacter capsici]QWF15746.1 hypothetical protein KME82_18455 [Lysobacter capsici]
MNSTTPTQAAPRDPRIDAAVARLLGNRDDEIEGTFCHGLFERGVFDAALFESLVGDMRLVASDASAYPAHRATIVWIALGVCRCVFSHFDADDGYRIVNLDDALYSKWSGDYFERLRELLD